MCPMFIDISFPPRIMCPMFIDISFPPRIMSHFVQPATWGHYFDSCFSLLAFGFFLSVMCKKILRCISDTLSCLNVWLIDFNFCFCF